jgi:hypothetical protein
MDIQDSWNRINNAMIEAAEFKLPKYHSKWKSQWMTREILQLMEERRLEKNRDVNRCRELNMQINEMIKQAKEEWLQEQCIEIELLQAMHKDRELHEKIKRTVGVAKRKPQINVVNDKSIIELEAANKKKIWEEYIQKLFHDDRAEEYPHIQSEKGPCIFKAEVEVAIRTTKDNKSPGEDTVTAEYFKDM